MATKHQPSFSPNAFEADSVTAYLTALRYRHYINVSTTESVPEWTGLVFQKPVDWVIDYCRLVRNALILATNVFPDILSKIRVGGTSWLFFHKELTFLENLIEHRYMIPEYSKIDDIPFVFINRSRIDFNRQSLAEIIKDYANDFINEKISEKPYKLLPSKLSYNDYVSLLQIIPIAYITFPTFATWSSLAINKPPYQPTPVHRYNKRSVYTQLYGEIDTYKAAIVITQLTIALRALFKIISEHSTVYTNFEEFLFAACTMHIAYSPLTSTATYDLKNVVYPQVHEYSELMKTGLTNNYLFHDLDNTLLSREEYIKYHGNSIIKAMESKFHSNRGNNGRNSLQELLYNSWGAYYSELYTDVNPPFKVMRYHFHSSGLVILKPLSLFKYIHHVMSYSHFLLPDMHDYIVPRPINLDKGRIYDYEVPPPLYYHQT